MEDLDFQFKEENLSAPMFRRNNLLEILQGQGWGNIKRMRVGPSDEFSKNV